MRREEERRNAAKKHPAQILSLGGNSSPRLVPTVIIDTELTMNQTKFETETLRNTPSLRMVSPLMRRGSPLLKRNDSSAEESLNRLYRFKYQ